MTTLAPENPRTLIDELLADQQRLTAVDRFARAHEHNGVPAQAKFYRDLIPLTQPQPGQQYAFEVNLDQCSGCKACVAACHSLNGLDENETWRNVGFLHGVELAQPFQQTVTTACHHCVDPGCLNGCPVLAYEKDPVTGIVRHLDDQCIGCQYCVMKCPYDVPKYSPAKGIVRKCDMCHDRLAVGEAPACVQACPHEAIRITVVEQTKVKTTFRNNGALEHFLPDSPDSRITLPTTRYISRRELPAGILAADHAALRLDHPHWPLVLMLVLTQAAAGMFLVAALGRVTGTVLDLRWLNLAGFAALNLGLMIAPLHLGQPLKAWRAFLGWRKSWLSREIIALNNFAAAAAAATALSWLPQIAAQFSKVAELLQKLPAWLPPLASWQVPLTLVAAAAGLGGVFASAMVYVDTRRPLWSPRYSFGNFFGTTLLLGTTFAAIIFGWAGPGVTTAIQLAALLALVVRTVLLVWRRLELRAALRDARSPIHFNARVISELLPRAVPAGTWLFVISTVSGLLAIVNAGGAAAWWASLAALTTMSAEIIARYIFFVAGASKRMPGGIAA
jgi:Fe-S-cluster-containing dehydrogenase component/DMSO reductase anchor subunit